MKKLFFLLIASLALSTVLSAQTIRVACVGNSITYGAGIGNRDKMSYPAQLQAWLGAGYTVRNFGVPGATLLHKGFLPYYLQSAYQEVLSFNPNIIIIKLGTNDARVVNWVYGAEFPKDLTEMVNVFKSLSARPRILLASPVPAFGEGNLVIDVVLREQLIPMIKSVAAATNCQFVDVYSALLPHRYAFPADNIHPSSIGTSFIAEKVYRSLF